MKIAILGWGSLIWCPGALKLRTRWHRDGPWLPIEFARISSADRVTLVIHPGSRIQQTLWAIADADNIQEVRQDLHQREGTGPTAIHACTLAGDFSLGVTEDTKLAMGGWLKVHAEIEGCVWTGLASNWQAKRARDFSVADAVRYLKELPDSDRAREYVRCAPRQIQTDVREVARRQLGWTDADLSSVLFEP